MGGCFAHRQVIGSKRFAKKINLKGCFYFEPRCYNIVTNNHGSMLKIEEKIKALELRRKGLTYKEILKQVPVAKSTLSLWLREVGLSKTQKQRITQKQIKASQRGGDTRIQLGLKLSLYLVGSFG